MKITNFLASVILTIQSAMLCHAQIDSLVNSGWTIRHAKALADSGKLGDAINVLKRIDARDTNYIWAADRMASYMLRNDQPREALAIITPVLERCSAYRADLLRWQAQAFRLLGNLEKAQESVKKGMEEFPFDATFAFEAGLIYRIRNEHEAEERSFFKAIELNPYYGNAHMYLGILSMLRGQRARAMMSMGMYLALEPDDNRKLVLLEEFLKNEITDDNTVRDDRPGNFERLDAILRAGVAMDKEYKTRIPIDVAVVRHFQLFFDELGNQKEVDDSWNKFYVQIYDQIHRQRLDDAFVYHILTSTKIDQVPQWKSKNQDVLKEMYETVNNAFKKYRSIKLLPDSYHFNGPVQAEFHDNQQLNSLGMRNKDGKEEGLWYYYAENGQLLAHGLFIAGKKNGWWNYYSRNGHQASKENEESGEIYIFNKLNEVVQHYYLKNNRVEGRYEFLYPCGALKETQSFTNGLREGDGKSFFADGKQNTSFTYESDSLEGAYVQWYPTGVKQIEKRLRKGMNNGQFYKYHPNGRLESKGNYINDQAHGEFTYYHPNGRISAQGEYRNDLPVGIWNSYDLRGNIRERTPYNDNGELDGTYEYYINGQIQYTLQYQNGKVIQVRSMDQTGRIALSSAEDKDGNFKCTLFFSDGRPRVDAEYRNGKANGTWTYYHHNGFRRIVQEYKDNAMDGKRFEYFENGKPSLVADYNDGKLHGKFESFYVNNQLRSIGYYVKGEKEQRWLTYYENGKTESDVYYLKGDRRGYVLNYAVDGRIFSKSEFDEDRIIRLTRYRPDGSIGTSEKQEGILSTITGTFASGKVSYHSTLLCGDLEGEEVELYPEGNIFQSYSYKRGLFDGTYVRMQGINGSSKEREGTLLNGENYGRQLRYHSNGKVYSEGYYMSGERDSTWIFHYDNGAQSSTINYMNGEKNGITRLFGPDGQLYMEKMYMDDALVSIRTAGPDGKLNGWEPILGKRKVISYYPNGTLAIEEFYNNGISEGMRKVYYASGGNLYSQFQYKEGNIEGECLVFFPDGKVKDRYHYAHDNLKGLSQFYEAGGLLSRTETYEEGVRNGKTEFYAAGKKIGEIMFWDGLPTE